MKYIISVIQPAKLDAVRETLTELGLSGMTVTEVQGYGRQKGKSEIYRGAEYDVHFVPKIKIEIAVADNVAGSAVEAIKTAAHADRIGDGKIFVLDLKEAIRIRTNEMGDEAL